MKTYPCFRIIIIKTLFIMNWRLIDKTDEPHINLSRLRYAFALNPAWLWLTWSFHLGYFTWVFTHRLFNPGHITWVLSSGSFHLDRFICDVTSRLFNLSLFTWVVSSRSFCFIPNTCSNKSYITVVCGIFQAVVTTKSHFMGVLANKSKQLIIVI